MKKQLLEYVSISVVRNFDALNWEGFRCRNENEPKRTLSSGLVTARVSRDTEAWIWLIPCKLAKSGNSDDDLWESVFWRIGDSISC